MTANYKQCKIVSSGDFEQINLVQEAISEMRFVVPSIAGPNPMRDPAFQTAVLARIKKKFGGRRTYGGYLEDRSVLWANFESSRAMIHLGVDINNLDYYEVVYAPCTMTAVDVYNDPAEFNGWGTRAIFKMAQPWLGADYLLIGHLSADWAPEMGKVYKQGEQIGRVGDINENGGWFVHLHVQLVKTAMWNYFLERGELNQLDGYLHDGEESKARTEEWSADPTDLIFDQARGQWCIVQ
jgi:hypothetical protein